MIRPHRYIVVSLNRFATMSITSRLAGICSAISLAESSISTMAEVEAFASSLQDVTAGPRFASAKIDGANLERVLSSRDGTYIVNRIRGSIGHTPI